MHQEALTLKARKIFPDFKHFPGFYLAGGTGLALQLGHRVSIDFDFFQKKYISKTLLSKIKKVFNGSKIKLVINHPEQLTVIVDGVNVSFIRYPFPIASKLIDYQGIKIASCLEIAAMKAYTLGRRATLKDYVDLYFVLHNSIANLQEVVDISEKKYRDNFNTRLFLEQLVYSKDVEKVKIKFLKGEITQTQMQIFFEQEIKKLKL